LEYLHLWKQPKKHILYIYYLYIYYICIICRFGAFSGSQLW
jgi:hypothetical protein